MQMAAAVAVDGEELSPDGEEPSPDRRRTTRSDDACAQSKTVLQDQAGSGRRGEDKKRAKAAADDDDAGATPLHAPSPGWSGKLAVAGPREAAPRPLVAVKLFPQAKKTAGEPEAEAAVVYPTAVSASTLDFCTLKACLPPDGENPIKVVLLKEAKALQAAKAKALKEAKSEAKALKALVADAQRAEREAQDKVCLPARATSASCRGAKSDGEARQVERAAQEEEVRGMADRLNIDPVLMREMYFKKKSDIGLDRARLGIGLYEQFDALSSAEVQAKELAEYVRFVDAAKGGDIPVVIVEGSFLVEAAGALLSLFDNDLLVSELQAEMDWLSTSCGAAVWDEAGQPRHPALRELPPGTSVPWAEGDAAALELALELTHCIAHTYGDLLTFLLGRRQ